MKPQKAQTTVREAMTSSVGQPVARRYIYGPEDMEEFKQSSARRELLEFASAMGRSCVPTPSNRYEYDPNELLNGLTPSMASLHGSLSAMAKLWITEIPPLTDRSKQRFGNPAFRDWHARLVRRSDAIVSSILRYMPSSQAFEETSNDTTTLQGAWQEGYDAAASESSSSDESMLSDQQREYSDDAILSHHADKKLKLYSEYQIMDEEKNLNPSIVNELRHYLYDSFGHPVRLDYGTGHESSFLVFLYSIAKLGVMSKSTSETTMKGKPPYDLGPIALSIFTQYLQVTRSVQLHYMLEPAGSHGVWGLDDYYCLAFYFGACQLIHNTRDIKPSSIHDKEIMKDQEFTEKYMYLSCIDYIRKIKTGVPFFESSPMLNDISNLKSWETVAKGLLRLYEGEVLDKRPVVQHFVFGSLFEATWTPSQAPPTAPQGTFYSAPGAAVRKAAEVKLPSNAPPNIRSPPPTAGGDFVPTRAPWAK